MTLKRAKLIAALIADLDKDCEHTDYVAGVKLIPSSVDEYSVELSSMKNHRNQLVDLICFAKSLDILATKVHTYYGPDYIELS